MVSSHESNTVGPRQNHGAQQKRHGDATEAPWTHHGRTRGTPCADTMEEPWGHHQGALWTPHAPPRGTMETMSERNCASGRYCFFLPDKMQYGREGPWSIHTTSVVASGRNGSYRVFPNNGMSSTQVTIGMLTTQMLYVRVCFHKRNAKMLSNITVAALLFCGSTGGAILVRLFG